MANLTQYINGRQFGQTSFLHMKKSVLHACCANLSLSNRIEFEVHSAGVNCLDVDFSGRYLMTGTMDGSVLVHDLFDVPDSFINMQQITISCSSNLPQSIETVQWYPFDSGMFSTSGMDRTLNLWDTERFSVVETFRFGGKIYQHHMCPIPSVNEALIAVASTLNKVIILDINIGQASHELSGHASSVLCCSWSPTTEYLLASGGCDSTIKLWDTRSARSALASLDMNNGQPHVFKTDYAKAHEGFVNGITFSPNGRFLLSTGTDSCLRCWDLHTAKNLNIHYGEVSNHRNKSLKFDVFGYGNYNMCFIPSEGNVLVFNVETGIKVQTLSGHYNFVNSCYFHKEIMELYSAGQDKNVLLWTHAKDARYLNYGRKKLMNNKANPNSWSDSDCSDDEGSIPESQIAKFKVVKGNRPLAM